MLSYVCKLQNPGRAVGAVKANSQTKQSRLSEYVFVGSLMVVLGARSEVSAAIPKLVFAVDIIRWTAF